MRPLARKLDTHRSYDAGALALAKALAKSLSAPLFASTVSRLIVDLNRSREHPSLHSPPIRALPRDEKNVIVRRYYEPHRNAVEKAIASRIARGHRVLHLAVHSFTPVLDGKPRHADVGLLYDPRRPTERSFCIELRRALKARDPSLHIRFNYPYLGKSDGLPTALRRRFVDRSYIGVEFEMNQRLSAPATRRRLARTLLLALSDVGKTPRFSDIQRTRGRALSNGAGRRATRSATP
jgi:predicted N-formylglutamate amidohydrolase